MSWNRERRKFPAVDAMKRGAAKSAEILGGIVRNRARGEAGRANVDGETISSQQVRDLIGMINDEQADGTLINVRDETHGEEFFIVGRCFGGKGFTPQWSFEGLYGDIGRAIAACPTKDHFVAPATLNIATQNIPVAEPGLSRWPGLRFPKAGSQSAK